MFDSFYKANLIFPGRNSFTNEQILYARSQGGQTFARLTPSFSNANTDTPYH